MSKKHILILALVIICIVVLLVLWPGMSVDVSNDDSVPVTVGFINPDADNTYYADVEFSVQELAAEEG